MEEKQVEFDYRDFNNLQQIKVVRNMSVKWNINIFKNY